MSAPHEIQTVHITSSIDAADQPAKWLVPEGIPKHPADRVPLLVGVHPWSLTYEEKDHLAFAEQCRRRGWVMIHPHFRGPNNNPAACASDLAVQDVLDAVAWARAHAPIDERRIYLVGSSGGGHMSLIMAGRAPQAWAAVSAWVPISDLAAWHAESVAVNRKYWRDLEGVCGGPPAPATQEQYRKRSPVTYLAAAVGLPLDINAGIHDGHAGSVPISHSLRAFNVLARAGGDKGAVVADADIDFMVANQTVPPALQQAWNDEPGRAHAILFRRSSGRARVTIFEGGHDIDIPTAFDWLARQPGVK